MGWRCDSYYSETMAPPGGRITLRKDRIQNIWQHRFHLGMVDHAICEYNKAGGDGFELGSLLRHLFFLVLGFPFVICAIPNPQFISPANSFDLSQVRDGVWYSGVRGPQHSPSASLFNSELQ